MAKSNYRYREDDDYIIISSSGHYTIAFRSDYAIVPLKLTMHFKRHIQSMQLTMDHIDTGMNTMRQHDSYFNKGDKLYFTTDLKTRMPIQVEVIKTPAPTQVFPDIKRKIVRTKYV